MTARTEFALTTDLVEQAAQADLSRWLRANRAPSEDEVRAVMAYLSETYGSVSADSAASYLFAEWGEFGGSYARLPYPDRMPVADVRQVEVGANWAMQTKAGGLSTVAFEDVKKNLSGVLARLVLQPGRDTVVQGAHRAGAAFARVAEPGACAFCTMLASRGGVYADSGTALLKDGVKWHDNCRCTTVQVRSDRELPKSSKRLMEQWRDMEGEPTLKNWAHQRYEASK